MFDYYWIIELLEIFFTNLDDFKVLLGELSVGLW